MRILDMASLKNDTQDVSPFTLTIRIPRITPQKIFHSTWTMPVLIMMVVFIFNLPYLFTDLLWHDDGFCYYMASEGNLPYGVAWRSQICTLAPYLDGFYSYGMIYLGLPLMRGIFVLVMALSSLFLYFLYRDSLGLDSRVAFLAAVLPNILPSLRGIPVGLNTSYAMWGLFPIVICLLLLTQAFKKQGFYSWALTGAAFLFYYLGLNLPGQPSSNFLIPCVLFFLAMFFPSQKMKSFLLLLPFLGLGIWQLYKQFLHSHKDPTVIPFGEIVSRVRQFFEMSDFLAFNSSFSIYLILVLILLGVAGLLSAKPDLFNKPDHFNYNPGLYRILLLGWPLCWIGSNSLAYVAASPTFRPYDYAYNFNFGAVLLQAVGIIYLATVLFALFRVHKSKNLTIGIFAILIILTTGIQRVYYRYSDWGWKTRTEQISKLIRGTLSKINIPQQAQIIILGPGSAHPGTYVVNSGDLRYLLSRTDISGLIGSDIYPNDVFAEVKGWTSDQMRNLDAGKPIIAFRNNKGTLERVNLLLQVVSTGNKVLPRLNWTLFNLKNGTEKPKELAHGAGISSYIEYLRNDLPPELRHSDIAFAPGDNPDTFIDEILANQVIDKNDILKTEISFENQITIQNIFINKEEENPYLQIVLRIDELPKGVFRLGYTMDGENHYVALWDFVMAGDRMLVNTPPISRTRLEKGVSIGLINSTGWPNKPLSISNPTGIGDNSAIVKWPSSEKVE